MPRYFTRDQAEQTLPSVEKAIREALFRKAEFTEADTELRQTARNVILAGGMMVNRERVGALKQTREEAARLLQDAFDEIQTHGCLIKDLDIGLLDFPTLFKGEEVYLCWRLGEERIEFWHGVTEGFRGRKRIDQEFLENHCGDPVS